MNTSRVSKHVYILLISLLSTLMARSQDSLNNRKVSIVSPNAASLGRYGDIPVSLNTGIPNISIPIYQLTNGDISVNISLSYHAGGVKVQDIASWVGLGWSLQAGGVISRTIQGAPDDRYGGSPGGTTHGHFTHYGFNSYSYSNVGANSACITSSPTLDGTAPHYDGELTRGSRDPEPDIFSFNFAGYSGKFHFGDDRSVVIVDGQTLKIVPTFQDSLFIDGFIVTVPSGDKYYFGKSTHHSVHAYEQTSVATVSGGHMWNPAISSWYLTKIESSDNHKSILLEYEQEEYSYYTIQNNNVLSSEENLFSGPAGSIPLESRLVTTSSKLFFRGVRLRKIISPDVQVDFIGSSEFRKDVARFNILSLQQLPNESARPLSEIRISSNATCKRFLLKQSYFYDAVSPRALDIYSFNPPEYDVDRYRLKLDEIAESSCDNTITKPPYLFQYNAIQPTRTLSFSQDHWGYHNGASNTSLMPGYWEDRRSATGSTSGGTIVFTPGANRETAWPSVAAGTLERITYPTGGTTTFEYEPNKVLATEKRFILDQQIAQGSIGYDGSNPLVRQISVHVSDAGMYQLTLLSSARGSDASLSILQGGVSVFSTFVTTSSTVTTSVRQDILLSQGNYVFQLSKDCLVWNSNGTSSTTGIGAQFMVVRNSEVSELKEVLVGGIRIKSIINNDNFSAPVIKSYSYNLDGQLTSSGILYGRPVYVSLLKTDLLKKVGYPSNTTPPLSGCISFNYPGVRHEYLKTSGSIFPMESVSGSHIGYQRVEEKTSGYGKTVNEYHKGNGNFMPEGYIGNIVNTSNPCDPFSPNFPPAPKDPDPYRGNLVKKSTYTEQGELKTVDEYTTYYNFNQFTVPGLKFSRWNDRFTFYELKSYRKTSQSHRSISFEGSQSIETEFSTAYESNYHSFPTAKYTTNTLGKQVANTKLYSEDILWAQHTINDGFGIYQGAVAAANINWNSSYCPPHPCFNCSWYKFHIWRRQMAVARTQLVAARLQYTSEKNALIAAYTTAQDVSLAGLGHLAQAGRVELIEELSKVNQVIINGNYSKFKWDSQNNVVVLDATFSLPSGKLEDWNNFHKAYISNNGTRLEVAPEYRLENYYKYFENNLVEVGSRNGTKQSYFWGYNNTKPIFHAVNVSFEELRSLVLNVGYSVTAPTHSEISDFITQFASTHPSKAIKGYTYLNGLGVETEQDVNKQLQQYVYDALGRMIAVKDKDGNVLKAIDYKYKASTNH